MFQISPEFYQHLAQNASIGLHVVDKNGIVLYANPYFAEMLGYTVEEIVGQHALKFVYEDDKAHLARSMGFLYQKKAQKHTFTENEARLVCADDTIITVESRTINLTDTLKKTTLFTITRDISAEKQTQEFLQNGQNQLQTILDNAKYSFFLINKDGYILYFNRSAKKFHALFFKEPLQIGNHITQYDVFQKNPEVFAQYIKSAFEEGKTIKQEQILQKPPHNMPAWAEVTISPIYDTKRNSHAVAISIIDTSARKRAENELRDNQAQLEVIFNNALHGVFLLDKENKIIMFNDKAKHETKKNWLRFPKIDESFLEFVHPNEMSFFLHRMNLCFTKKESKYMEAELTIGKGNYQKKVWYEIYYSPIPNAQGEINMVAVSFLSVNARKHAEFALLEQHEKLKKDEEDLLRLNKQLTSRRANLQSLNKELENKNEQLKQANEQIIQQQESLQNALYSEKKLNAELLLKNQVLAQQEEELKAINENLRNKQDEMKYTLGQLSDRNFELDQLIYRTSHDIRSPLASVLGLVTIMRYENIPQYLEVYIDKIESSIKKLDDFTNSMLAFGKTQRTERLTEKIDFEAIIQKCWEDLQYMPNFQKVDKQVQITIDDSVFVSDGFRMEIIFANIISNAIKYQNPHIDNRFLHISINIQKQKVCIQFKDNGIGIKQEYLNKIFDMFFRATDKAEGSGLGLYIVKQTIEKLGGKIEVISEYGQGTHITIWF